MMTVKTMFLIKELDECTRVILEKKTDNCLFRYTFSFWCEEMVTFWHSQYTIHIHMYSTQNISEYQTFEMLLYLKDLT
jgi:hypothetical protein